MTGIPFRRRIVEVLCRHERDLRDRWVSGSGFLVGGRLVLTSAHVIWGASEIRVRAIRSDARSTKDEWSATVKLAGDPASVDLALLEVEDFAPDFPAAQFAAVKRDGIRPGVVKGCWAVGFPTFKDGFTADLEHRTRETAQVNGEIPTGEDLNSGLLTLRTKSTPRSPSAAADGSPWSGFSGAAVFADESIVGVITEHSPKGDPSSLTVTPVTNVEMLGADFADRWWSTLQTNSLEILIVCNDDRRGSIDDGSPTNLENLSRMLAGIQSISTDFSARITNFLVEYVGSVSSHVPFGGRQPELLSLHTWLNSPDASPFLVLSAPAGRGKSAILAQWSLSLATRDDLSVVYFPISVRYRTNLAGVVFPGLVARLAAIHGDAPPKGADISIEAWRGILSDYLMRPAPVNSTIVLIIDGLDEGADWEAGADLFPSRPPHGLRIVVAARTLASEHVSAGWMDRLGWDRNVATEHSLQLLDESGVHETTTRMPGWSAVPEVIDEVSRELYRLTDGDPLLLRLYLQSIDDAHRAGQPISAITLHDLRPGLSGFFERWWQDQRKLWGTDREMPSPVLQFILGVLSHALGPLNHDDLVEIALPELKLSTWSLSVAIEQLRRLIIGNAHDQGYSFTHSRLAEYFSGQLTKAEQRATNERFLAWGERTLASLFGRQIEVRDVSGYLVQYYGAHLLASNADPTKLAQLASGPWCEAWEMREGSHAGFLNDVERARRSAELANHNLTSNDKAAEHLALEISCVLARASVRTMSGNLPAELIRSLVSTELWAPTQGLAYARQQPTAYQTASTIALIAPFLTPELMEAALDCVATLPDQEAKAKAISALAPHLPERLRIRATSIATSIDDSFHHIIALIGVAESLPSGEQQGAYSEALSAAGNIREYWLKAKLLDQLIPHISHEYAESVFQVAHQITDWQTEDRITAQMLRQLPRDHPERMAEIARLNAPNKSHLIQGQICLISDLQEPDRSHAIDDLIAYCAKNNSGYSAGDNLDLFIHLLDARQFQIALDAVREIKKVEYRAQGLTSIAKGVPVEQRSELVDEILELLPEVPQRGGTINTYMSTRPKVVASLAPHMTSAQVKSAAKIVLGMTDPESRVHAMTALLPRMQPDERRSRIDSILDWLADIPESDAYGTTLRRSAIAFLANTVEPDELPLIAMAARLLDDRIEQTMAMIECLAWAPSDDRAEIIDLVLQRASNLRSSKDQATILVRLAEACVPQERTSFASFMLTVIRTAESPHLLTQFCTLEPSNLDVAIDIASSFAKGQDKYTAIEGLVSTLSSREIDSDLLNRVLEPIRGTGRAQLLTALSGRLPESLLDFAFTECASIGASEGMLGETIPKMATAAIAVRLPGREQRDIIDTAIALACKYDSFVWVMTTLGMLAPHLTRAQLDTVLESAWTDVQTVYFGSPTQGMKRGSILRAVLPFLTPDQMAYALESAMSKQDTEWFGSVLLCAVGHLPPSLVGRALTLAGVEESEAEEIPELTGDRRLQVWVKLAPYLSFGELSQLLEEVGHLPSANSTNVFISESSRRPYRYLRGTAIQELAAILPADLLDRAIDIALSIQDADALSSAIAAIGPRLNEVQADSLMDRLIAIPASTQGLTGPYSPLAGALTAVAPRTSADRLSQVVAVAASIPVPSERARALRSLKGKFANLSRAEGYAIWQGALKVLEAETRDVLLSDLTAMAPLIASLCQAESASDVASVISKAGGWWP